MSCTKPTQADDKAMACDVCDNWEHVGCLRRCDKLSDELSEALQLCRSRALMYVCTRCRVKGPISEVASARAQEERPDSAQRIDELSECIRELPEEKQKLLIKQAALEEEVQYLISSRCCK